MSQPVKLSDSLVLDARLKGKAAQRSIAGQIEYWARVGRAIEPILKSGQAMAMCREDDTKSLSECLKIVGTPAGQRLLDDYLESEPYPHFESVPDSPNLLVKIDENGKRTIGRFINRKFQAVKRRRR